MANSDVDADLVAYLDDSGTDPDNPYLIVAGFAADVAQWKMFTDEITSLDRHFEAPPFHAKTFEKARHGHGPYAAWPTSKRHEYLNRFLGIIGRRCFKSFGTMLEKRAYENIVRPQRAFQEYFYSPTVFAALNSMHSIRQWRDALYPERALRFVFDRGNKNEGQLTDVCNRVAISSERLSLADDVQVPPLRAADLLAFELCAEGRRAVNPKSPFSRHALLQLDNRPHDWVGVEEDSLLNEISVLINDGTFIVS
jgi:hypothetical protein